MATSVNSITRAFNSVASAVTESTDGTHLGTGDLTAIGRRLTWICYDDTFFDVSSTTTITGYTTDVVHFITLTVAGASQVATGNSQRHLGVAGSRAYDGDYERVSPHAIPGLGSSPAGASHRYVDSGLDDGVTYLLQVRRLSTSM